MKEIKEKVSIIMPAYNEEGSIASSMRETLKTFEDFGCQWEMIVMDDGSLDDTFKEANSFAEQHPDKIIVKKNQVNLGKGRAIKKALRYVSGDYVVWLDADMDLHPIQIQTFFDIMRLNKADIVIGSKMHPNSVVDYPLQRKIISLVYYIFVRILFNLPCHDTQTGLKLFRLEVLNNVFPRILVKKFAFDLEVLVNARHLGYKISEAPIVLRTQRNYGRIGGSAIFTTLVDTLAIWYRMYILRYYDRINYYRKRNLLSNFRRMRR